MTQITEATSKTKCPKTFWPPNGRPVKISPPKGEKPEYKTELYRHANLSPGKNTYFPYRRLPRELLSHAIHFQKSLVEPMLRPI